MVLKGRRVDGCRPIVGQEGGGSDQSEACSVVRSTLRWGSTDLEGSFFFVGVVVGEPALGAGQ